MTFAGVPAVGVDDNFFQLGGDSLVLTRMVLAVERRLGIRVDFGRFVATPTVNGLLAAEGKRHARRHTTDLNRTPRPSHVESPTRHPRYPLPA